MSSSMTPSNSNSSSRSSSTYSSHHSSPDSQQITDSSADSGFWKGLASKARTVLDEPGFRVDYPKPYLQRQMFMRGQGGIPEEGKQMKEDSLALHKGLEAIASSLSLLSDTLGSAIEEGLSLIEKKAKTTTFSELQARRRDLVDTKPTPEKSVSASPKLESGSCGKPVLTKDTQMKASRDVAMAMTTKAKLLLRELQGIRSELTFSRNRCAQLEEENRRLRESIEKGVRHEEDDLIRLQLETLLAEKARLTQENTQYARENQILHEVVQYHQSKLRDIALTDEDVMVEDENMVLDDDEDGEYVGATTAAGMDLLPLYPQEDIIALEESPILSENQRIV